MSFFPNIFDTGFLKKGWYLSTFSPTANVESLRELHWSLSHVASYVLQGRANRQAFSYKTWRVVGQVLGAPLFNVYEDTEENLHTVWGVPDDVQ